MKQPANVTYCGSDRVYVNQATFTYQTRALAKAGHSRILRARDMSLDAALESIVFLSKETYWIV